jgi:hypothetical protein
MTSSPSSGGKWKYTRKDGTCTDMARMPVAVSAPADRQDARRPRVEAPEVSLAAIADPTPAAQALAESLAYRSPTTSR